MDILCLKSWDVFSQQIFLFPLLVYVCVGTNICSDAHVLLLLAARDQLWKLFNRIHLRCCCCCCCCWDRVSCCCEVHWRSWTWKSPRFHLFPPPKGWNYECVPPHLAFHMRSGNQVQFFMHKVSTFLLANSLAQSLNHRTSNRWQIP